MASPLTGDFDAVLQVSAGTVNRLLGRMHERGGMSGVTDFRIPHGAIVRIGDPEPVSGLRGTAYAQLAVPRIQLIDGATDRFRLEIHIRALYRPDLGWPSLPELIEGRVSAEYRMSAVDPACPGYAGVAHDFVWFRVDERSVTFTGTAVDDPPASPPPDAQQVNKRIVRALRHLLAVNYAPKPHRISGAEFRAGSMISLAGDAGAAIAVPIDAAGTPGADIGSIRDVVLEDAHMAVAVGVHAVMKLVDPFVDAVAAYAASIPVHVDTPWPAPDIDTVYRVRMQRPTVEWHAHDTTAILKFRVRGTAKTDSILPDASFGIEQDVVLSFDPAQQRLWVTPGSRLVSVDVTSVVGASTIRDAVRANINATVAPMVATACAQAQPQLDAMIARRERLEQELLRFDTAAGVDFRRAQFTVDGLILRGEISLTRWGWPVIYVLPFQPWRALMALPSWIPAGRIDRFEWSWSWPSGIHPGGTAAYGDRFILRRPPGEPQPGIDGPGRVCIRISGKQVSHADGRMVPVASDWGCAQFGPAATIVPAPGTRFLLREVHGDREVALVDVAAPAGMPTANTLVLYAEDDLDDAIVATLRDGLAARTRDDAGLAVFVLFPDGRLAGVAARADDDPARRLRDVAPGLPAPVLVNEDVVGAWSEQLGLRADDAGPTWCLIAATGGVAWTHQGPLAAPELAQALDAYLFTSPPPDVIPAQPSIELGAPFDARLLEAAPASDAPSCPPPPFAERGMGTSIVSFVRSRSAASEAAAQRLQRVRSQYEQAPLAVFVVDGLDQSADFAAAAPGSVTIPDPEGVIAARFGIRAWPTTIVVDADGAVAAVEVGVDPRIEEAS